MDDAKPRKKRKLLTFGCGGCLAVILVLVATPFVAGSLMADDYHGHVTARYAAPPDEVWAALVDHHRTPIAGAQHLATEDLAPENGLAVWKEDLGETTITVRTVEALGASRLVRELSDSVVPMTARVELALEPDGDGTRVVGTNRITVRDGTWHVPLFRFVLTVTGGANASLREYLGGIGSALGTPATIE
jgi:hypothetical protein